MKQDIFSGNEFFKSSSLDDNGKIIKSDDYYERVKIRAKKKIDEGEVDDTKEANRKASAEIKEEEAEAMKKKKGKDKVGKVMSEWKEGKLHQGKSKKKVPKTEQGRKQAIAIAMSEAGMSRN